MSRLTPLHIIPALIAAASHAGEITIELRPFSIEKSFSAAALPDGDCTLLRLDPKSWTDFEILKIASHGAQVAKGDLLVSFDSEAIDRKIEDTRRELASSALTLAQAELDLKILEETAPNKLEAGRRAAEIAKEENTYFTQIRRKAAEDSANQSLKRSEQILANQREELKQLSKMYEADDITENTEEIILVRQQDAVASAEFALHMETLDHKRTLEVTLPREAKKLADSERDTAINFKKTEADIPRSIELNKLALEALKSTQKREAQTLAELEADRALFEIKAPADGFFYHGPIENGRWTMDDFVKKLIPHGHPPTHAAFATFVPGSANLALVSFLDEATARALKPDLTGIATLSGLEDEEIPVKLLKIASTPTAPANSNTPVTYRVDLSAAWPGKHVPPTGSTARIRLISYQQAAAIVIPTQALDYESSGWTVEVKLANGKTERRPVKRGHNSNDETEILSGLEVGQVVVVPGEKS